MTTKVDKFLGGLGIDATNKLELASNATVTVGNGTATGNVHVGGNMSIGNIGPGTHDLAIAGSALIAGDLTLSAGGDGALQFPVASSIKVLDNSATSLVIEEADTAYITIVTTDGSEAIKFDKALDINAAIQLDASLTIGANDQGYDVILYGDTASANMTWDTSADALILNGHANLTVPEGNLKLGSTFVTSTAAEINQLDAITRGSIIYGNSSGATARLAKGGAGVLTSDGTDISWAAGSGIASVVADTSPQLGGTLDGNGQDINITTNKKVQFRDAALFINSSTDGQLDIAADALTKVSGNVTLGTNASNTITLTGTLDCGTL